MTPKVSIIVPVYNVERYLARCLDSIGAQTERDLEIICVNDGSTDASGSILADYAAKDARIREISQPNSGQIASWFVFLHEDFEFLEPPTAFVALL